MLQVTSALAYRLLVLWLLWIGIWRGWARGGGRANFSLMRCWRERICASRRWISPVWYVWGMYAVLLWCAVLNLHTRAVSSVALYWSSWIHYILSYVVGSSGGSNGGGSGSIWLVDTSCDGWGGSCSIFIRAMFTFTCPYHLLDDIMSLLLLSLLSKVFSIVWARYMIQVMTFSGVQLV